MALHRNPQRRFDQALRLISGVAELPPEIVTLRGRLSDFTVRTGTPMADRLAAAVLDADTDADTDLLWSASLAEAASTPASHNDLLNTIRSRVHAQIREHYAAHAIAVYESVGEKFTAAAEAFTAAAATVDPETPAELIIDATDRIRKAWRSAEIHAAELHRLLEPLLAAAVLAKICGDDADALLPLTVDTDGLHRREVWSAWETEQREDQEMRAVAAHSIFATDAPTRSRCGRWSALLALGAKLRACPADAFTEYRRPRPMQARVENTEAGPRRTLIDPEDADIAVISVAPIDA